MGKGIDVYLKKNHLEAQYHFLRNCILKARGITGSCKNGNTKNKTK